MVQTIASVFRWFGPILEVQVTLVIVWEGVMVLADYRKEQREKEVQKAREKGREEVLNELPKAERQRLLEVLKQKDKSRD